MKINQFHSGAAPGDAITNQMLMIQDILRQEGFESDIYAEHIPDELAQSVKNIKHYKGDKDSILIIHHSMGFNAFEKIVSFPDKKILIYHNITPERFFSDEFTKSYIRKGIQQLKEYRKYVDYAIADSNYNRRDMLSYGYKKVDVMPIQISLDRFDNTESDSNLAEKLNGTKNILFVGRLVWNKRQTDIVRAFGVYTKYYNKNARLFLVGDDSNQAYVREIRQEAEDLKIEEKVVITGKVSESELKTYYEEADIFFSMSEHEGFGVPLLEAMKLQVPVIAYASSAIRETMDGAGILFDDKSYGMIAALINEILENEELYVKIVSIQNERIDRLTNTDTRKLLLQIITNLQNGKQERTVQMQGPFETSYSLAIVNRKLIEAIDRLGEYNCSIHCTEGPGDYQPKESDLKDKPNAKRLWLKSQNISFPDITIRNMYPPRVRDVKGGLNFQSFGWEESGIPKQFIDDFNQYLDGIGTTSDYVTSILKENGIKIPVKTMGNGVELCKEFNELKPYLLKTKKNKVFLHISSAFPRKGVDLLLQAYFEEFSSEDDVCLVLKTFPNPHNEVERILTVLQKNKKDAPEVEWINKDLSQKELNRLYKAADCYVQVARGEGFGLPVAEAMLAKIPVIVSPNSGMADFCNDKTALLVDYTMEVAKTHVYEGESYWAKPNTETLKKQMRAYVDEPEALNLDEKIEAAYEMISKKYTWDAVAARWNSFIKEVTELQYKPDVAMVTTWNSKCGIAEYSRFIVEEMNKYVRFTIYPNYGVALLKKDEDYVAERLWDNAFRGDLKALTDKLKDSNHEIINLQFNFGFFNLKCLQDMIEQLHSKKKVVITFHKTEDADVGGKIVSLRSIAGSLNKCALLVVHQERDKEVLVSFGISPEIIKVIAHGQLKYPYVSPATAKRKKGIESSFVFGSYGFLLPHKGILEAIEAVSIIKKEVPDVLYIASCALHESQDSANYLSLCQQKIKELHLEENVRMETAFLPNDISMSLLQACDAVVLPYHRTKESASGALRFCLASYRPLITTNQPIFSEASECAIQIEDAVPSEIAEALLSIYNGKDIEQQIINIREYVEKSSWENYSLQLYEGFTEIIGRK